MDEKKEMPSEEEQNQKLMHHDMPINHEMHGHEMHDHDMPKHDMPMEHDMPMDHEMAGHDMHKNDMHDARHAQRHADARRTCGTRSAHGPHRP